MLSWNITTMQSPTLVPSIVIESKSDATMFWGKISYVNF
jgi:hypothetical protein